MNKLSLKLLVLLLGMFLLAGTASADLIGIKDYEGNLPDVLYDSGGTATYDATNDIFEVVAWDQTLYLEKPGPGIGLGSSSKVGFGIAIEVDSNGDLVGGVSGHTYTWGSTTYDNPYGYDMVEYVLEDFSFDYDGTTYNFSAGDIFLAADVIRFGWQDNASGFDEFDFLFESVSGKMVTNGLWPTGPYWYSGAYLDTQQWLVGTADWDPWQEDLDVGTAKGNKYPVPEPATMVLIGTGLLGLAIVGRKSFFKKD